MSFKPPVMLPLRRERHGPAAVSVWGLPSSARRTDGISWIHRDKDSNLCLNFETGGIATAGARPKHLANKDIVVAENNGDGTFTSHWERIFPSLKA